MADDSTRQRDNQPEHARHIEHGVRDSESGQASQEAPVYPTSLLSGARLDGRGNDPVRIALMRQVQQTHGNRAARQLLNRSIPVQRDNGDKKKEAEKEPQLLTDFTGKFKDAADHIRKSPAAMTLVKEASAAKVKFGGYAEDGPGKASGRAYTVGDTVYVPKARVDPVLAMKSFLFELNNAIRKPKFTAIFAEARKGSKGTLTAEQYAYKIVEQEVEGMLRLGEVWFETKKTMGKGDWNKYDSDFYYSEYKQFNEKKKTKDDIVKDVLKRVYDSGDLKGKTVEDHYKEQYEKLSGGK
jgi:hypothetical protein